MGVSKTVQIICDYSGCRGGQTGPSVLVYNETEVEAGKTPAPEAAQYLVLLNYKNRFWSFCCQLCAARFFLPPGYEAKQKDVVPMPEKPGWKPEEPEPKSWKSWMDEPVMSENDPRRNSPENGQEVL